MTRTLPTNKRGEVYYGPQSVAEAVNASRNLGADPEQVVQDMRDNGYTGAAARVAKQFGV